MRHTRVAGVGQCPGMSPRCWCRGAGLGGRPRHRSLACRRQRRDEREDRRDHDDRPHPTTGIRRDLTGPQADEGHKVRQDREQRLTRHRQIRPLCVPLGSRSSSQCSFSGGWPYAAIPAWASVLSLESPTPDRGTVFLPMPERLERAAQTLQSPSLGEIASKPRIRSAAPVRPRRNAFAGWEESREPSHIDSRW